MPRLSQDVSGMLAAERNALRSAEAAKGAASAACQEAKASKRNVDNVRHVPSQSTNLVTPSLSHASPLSCGRLGQKSGLPPLDNRLTV